MIQKPEFKTAMGAKADGVIGTLPGTTFVDSEYTGTNALYKTNYDKGKAFKEAYVAKYGEQPSIAANAGYDGFWVWAEAVKRVGNSTDYAAIVKDMLANKYDGIVGRFGFDPTTQAGFYGPENLPINYYQMQGGKVVTLALGAGRSGREDHGLPEAGLDQGLEVATEQRTGCDAPTSGSAGCS